MKYCIVHINDRAKNNIEINKKILKNFQYVEDIKFFDGNNHNGWDVLNHMGIPLDTWSPYDGRTTGPLPGEYGVWVSTINIWNYIVNNNIDKFLVIEDDVLLKETFSEDLLSHIKDLPDDFDFLSLYYFNGQNWDSEQTEIGSNLIKLSHNQFSAAQAMVYSFSGANKLLKLIKTKGMEYTNDCFIYNQAFKKIINGYSIKGPRDMFLTHTYADIKSTIDPTDLRNTPDL